MVQQASEVAIDSFINKATASNERKAKYKINNINKELDGMSFMVLIISSIYSTEDTNFDAWNNGLEYKKYGAGLGKTNYIDIYCINGIKNRISIKILRKWFLTTLSHKLNNPINDLIFLIMWYIPRNKILSNILWYYLESLF